MRLLVNGASSVLRFLLSTQCSYTLVRERLCYVLPLIMIRSFETEVCYAVILLSYECSTYHIYCAPKCEAWVQQ